MNLYTITDRISGTVLGSVSGDDDSFPIYDTGDTCGLLGYSKEDVADILGTSDFDLVVTRGFFAY